MEKHKFVCSKCGSEYFLQAWKAVCPNCNSEYTLTRVEEKPEARRVLTARELGALAIVGYVGYSMLLPTQPSLISLVTIYAPLVPAVILYALFMLLGTFLFLGVSVGIWLSIVVGFLAAANGLWGLASGSVLSIIPITLAVVWTIGASLFRRRLRAIESRQSDEWRWGERGHLGSEARGES